jgi:hypothetical protein
MTFLMLKQGPFLPGCKTFSCGSRALSCRGTKALLIGRRDPSRALFLGSFLSGSSSIFPQCHSYGKLTGRSTRSSRMGGNETRGQPTCGQPMWTSTSAPNDKSLPNRSKRPDFPGLAAL